MSRYSKHCKIRKLINILHPSHLDYKAIATIAKSIFYNTRCVYEETDFKIQ